MAEPVKRKRPYLVKGSTLRLRTQCGHLFITLNADEESELLEVLGLMGKAGGCMRAIIEGLTRMVTLALKYRVPVKEIVLELQNISCPGGLITEDGAQSCPDAIAKCLKAFLNEDKFEFYKGGKRQNGF